MSKRNDRVAQNVIRSDLTDRLFFNEITKESKTVQGLVSPENDKLTRAVLGEVNTPVMDLCQDIFSSLYRVAPEVVQEGPKLQRDLLEQMMTLPEYKQLRHDTRGDELSSAIGLTQLAPPLLKQLQQAQEEIEKQKQKQKDKGEEGPDGLDAMSEDFKASLRAGMREALKAAQDKSEEAKEVLNAWGATPGELKKLPLADRMALVDQLKNQPKFGAITELIGRFKTVKGAVEATTFSHGHDEIVDIELGNDLARLLPSELMKFEHNELLFMKDFVEGNLMQYQVKGTDNLGRGPVVVCFDISPSMEMNGAHAWCKAAVLTLMEVCRKQNRAFGAIAFESVVQYMQFWGKGQRPTLQDKLEISEMGTTGGTNFIPPLEAAFELRNRESALKPADIVFITDGQCGLSPEQYAWIAEQKAKTNVRIFGIGIGGGSVGSIETFCDELVALSLSGDVYRMEEMKKLLSAVTAAG